MLAGWAKADSAPLRTREFYQTSTFGIQGVFNYTDGTTSSTFTASFNPDTDSQNNWQYSAQVMVAEKAYSSITVKVVYDYNVNTALFDGTAACFERSKNENSDCSTRGSGLFY